MTMRISHVSGVFLMPILFLIGHFQLICVKHCGKAISQFKYRQFGNERQRRRTFFPIVYVHIFVKLLFFMTPEIKNKQKME